MASPLDRLVKAEWHCAVLVCRKCSKRIGGGFGKKGKHSLAKALRAHLSLGRGRRATIGIVETRCLGVCPRGGVTVINTAHPNAWRIVPQGANVAAAARDLGLTNSD